jgi:hypothetical protein
MQNVIHPDTVLFLHSKNCALQCGRGPCLPNLEPDCPWFEYQLCHLFVCDFVQIALLFLDNILLMCKKDMLIPL